jgi:hypothetical protein
LVKRTGPRGHRVIVFVLARCESMRKKRGAVLYLEEP